MADDDVSTDAGPLRRRTLTAHNGATMRTVTDFGEAGCVVLDEPVRHGGTGEGPTPLQAVLTALCGCEAVTFNRTAAELGLAYSALDFEAAFTIDIRGRQGNRSVRPHFQRVRVLAVVSTAEPAAKLAAVIAETEARCPVMNLLLTPRSTCRSSGSATRAAPGRRLPACRSAPDQAEAARSPGCRAGMPAPGPGSASAAGTASAASRAGSRHAYM
ncbi:MAG: OsmC family protein [Streptosporangiaceae bacterium]